MRPRMIRLVSRKGIFLYAVALIVLPVIGHTVTIASLQANTGTVGRYEKYELTFALSGVSPADYNPFRPDTVGDSLSPAGVDVRAEITTPSGRVQKVWGFYDVDLEYMGNSSSHPEAERLVPVSAPHWHVRYAPTELGTHRVVVRVTDSAGTSSSQQLTFACVESGRKGFVKVSADGTRFVYSDGSPFVPFGMMMPYGTEKVVPVTSAMKSNGMNFLRYWLVNRDKIDIHRDMESWLSYSTDASVYHSGQRSAVKTITGTGTLVDQSFIGCKPSTYYKAFAYIKTSSSFNGQVAVYVSEDGNGVSTVNHVGTKIGGNQNWTLSQVIFKTGSTAEMLNFKPRVLSGSAGTIWIDDTGLYECDSSGNILVDFNMIVKPSFEKWTPVQLRLKPLARFEYLLQRCEENGIVVQPVLFDYRLWNNSDPMGFYSLFFGDWWTDGASIAQQERVIRYLVARFGHYRSLFAWELANEMDASYTEVRGDWIAGRANFIRANDPYGHPITNSLWNSPGDFKYAQMRELDLNQVHYYINTEERTTGQGYPSWWNLSSGMVIDTNAANAASGSKSLKATANGSTISDYAKVYCQPGKSYTLRYKIKTSGVSGQASVIVRFYGGTSPSSTITLSHTGTSGYTSRTQSFTTGSTATDFDVNLQLTGSSGTAWWDDVEVVDNDTGLSVLYNGGFESPLFGDDEFEWGVYNTIRTRERYLAGANGTNKAWGSGEFGLMGANADLSYWARYNDATKPRHDSTGIHVHNCIWAQLMASSALNTPTYWWVDEYILPFNLYGVWKGATSFTSALPFYDRGQTVSTDSGAAEVLAISSNSRIRLLGQKKGNSGYFWVQNSQNTWSRVIRDGLAPTPTSATITIPGFENGVYTLRWYDTYSGSVARTESKSMLNGVLDLSVSSLSTDTAVIVQKQQPTASQPEITMTLAVDKANALPSETVTYTLAYMNKGNAEAVNVEIELPVPAHTAVIPASISSGGTYDSSGNLVRWVIPSIPAGGSGSCRASVKIE